MTLSETSNSIVSGSLCNFLFKLFLVASDISHKNWWYWIDFFCFAAPRGGWRVPARLQISAAGSDRGLTSLSRTLHPSRRSATQQLPAEGAVKPARLQLWIASVQLQFTQRGGKRSYHPLTMPHAVGRSCSTTSPVITCDFLSLSHLLQWFHCSQTTNNKLQLVAKRHDRVPSSIDWGLKMLPPSQEMEVKLKSELRLE